VWTFAHNGQLKGIKDRILTFYEPVGSTDSEHAFCWLLDQIRMQYPEPPKSTSGLMKLIRHLAADLGTLGVFNMLLSDGRSLGCHCATNRAGLTRKAPFGAATLVDADMSVDFSKETTPNDIVTVIATRPLTRDEAWTVMQPGQMAVFRSGLLVTR
jgi:glutamine amidotransferase